MVNLLHLKAIADQLSDWVSIHASLTHQLHADHGLRLRRPKQHDQATGLGDDELTVIEGVGGITEEHTQGCKEPHKRYAEAVDLASGKDCQCCQQSQHLSKHVPTVSTTRITAHLSNHADTSDEAEKCKGSGKSSITTSLDLT